MGKITVKVKLVRTGAKMPSKGTSGSAGWDLTACINKEIWIPPLHWKSIPTGIAVEIPPGYEGQIRPRSGLAARAGAMVLNSPGTIDSDYRGEIKVLLYNGMDARDLIIKPKQRIAQLVIAAIPQVNFESTGSLSETERGAGGFGSTGDC